MPEAILPTNYSWMVRTLGCAEVISASGQRPRFRSKTVASLLSFLALHQDEGVSKTLLEETFWPESEPHQQAQNLRRALSDLRDGLQCPTESGFLQSTRHTVALAGDSVIADCRIFAGSARAGLAKGDKDLLRTAVELYRGPLLAPIPDEWVYGYRLEYEELFAQALEELSRMLIEAGNPKEAVLFARSALAVAPSREDIHISLIRGYRACGLEAEAIRQFEDLERMLDDTWGEPPSKLALEALESPMELKPTTPVSSADGQNARPVIPAEGALPLDSPFYVRRNVDQFAEECIDRGEVMVLLQGPRLSGKSSLLARLFEKARQRGYCVAHADIQAYGRSQLESIDRLYRALAYELARQTGATTDVDARWKDWLGPNVNLDSAIGAILAEVDGPVFWAIDKADRLFGKQYSDDLFGLLRSWHNRRAMDPSSSWRHLHLTLAYAAEPHLFISDLNQSPFNIGVRIVLSDFSLEEVRSLAIRCGVADRMLARRVFALTSGHPYYSRCLLSLLKEGMPIDQLETAPFSEEGQFSAHMDRTYSWLKNHAGLLNDVVRLLNGEPLNSSESMFQLWSAGITNLSDTLRPSFRTPIHRNYYRVRLLSEDAI